MKRVPLNAHRHLILYLLTSYLTNNKENCIHAKTKMALNLCVCDIVEWRGRVCYMFVSLISVTNDLPIRVLCNQCHYPILQVFICSFSEYFTTCIGGSIYE